MSGPCPSRSSPATRWSAPSRPSAGTRASSPISTASRYGRETGSSWDYGNSLSAANPPHLFGRFADYVYALPGSYLFKVPDSLPSEIAVLTEVMAVTAGLDKAK
jgi:threonine dehydrogenase-like Zn-dependent dehydrogenase